MFTIRIWNSENWNICKVTVNGPQKRFRESASYPVYTRLQDHKVWKAPRFTIEVGFAI